MILVPGQELFREGEPGDRAYIIRAGRVRILKKQGNKQVALTDLGPGSILGEMSLLDKQPRSATALAVERSDLAEIDQTLLENAYASFPTWLTSILRMVVQRLRETTARKYSEDMRGAVSALLLCCWSRAAGAIPGCEPQVPGPTLQDVQDDMLWLYGVGPDATRQLLRVLSGFGLLEIATPAGFSETVLIDDPRMMELVLAHFGLGPLAQEPILQINHLEHPLLDAMAAVGIKARKRDDGRSQALFADIGALLPKGSTVSGDSIEKLVLAGMVETVPKWVNGQVPDRLESMVYDPANAKRLVAFSRLRSRLDKDLAAQLK